jgi:peptide/nickel transport system ATP-binding protein
VNPLGPLPRAAGNSEPTAELVPSAAAGGTTAAVVSVRDLSVAFNLGARTLTAVDGVSFDIFEHDIFALVGESGSGKSTLAAALVELVPPPGRIVAGDVWLRGASVQTMSASQLRHARGAEVAMVFQAAMSSFNPVVTIERQVVHSLEAHPEVWPTNNEGMAYFDTILRLLNLPVQRVRSAYESQLSGGMKQRVAIALALVLKPSVLVLDEPTTALDVINQRTVIEVLRRIHGELGVTILFVTHDLGVVGELARTIGIMYAGQLVQVASTEEIFEGSRRHPYVTALLASVLDVLDDERGAASIPGMVPRLDDLPPGCRFAPRCMHAMELCRRAEPRLYDDGSGNAVACFVVNDEHARDGVRL